jgi:hypothetical protein
MIRAKSNDGTIILGIDAENVKRLTQGDPILVKGETLAIEHDIYIVYGESLERLAEQLGLPKIQ